MSISNATGPGLTYLLLFQSVGQHPAFEGLFSGGPG